MQTDHAVVEEATPRAGLWEMTDLATPMAVRVAATLRIADHVARGPQTADELAATVSADPQALDCLLRLLAAHGLLRRDATGAYTLTAAGDELRDDHPHRMRERLDIGSTYGRADLAFVQLLHTIRTGEAAYPVQHGRSFWDDLSADPERSAAFNSRMGSDVTSQFAAIASAYDWGSLGHVVDVGGGNGSLLMALLRHHPTLRGTLVDLPPGAEAARRAFAAAGLDGRAGVAPGSFFDPLPAGAGGYTLSAIIHNWDDGAARAILRRCAEAAGAAGRVFIVERMVGEGEPLLADMDMRLLVWYGGRARTLAELGALAEDAGLRLAGTHAAGAVRIVELAAR